MTYDPPPDRIIRITTDPGTLLSRLNRALTTVALTLGILLMMIALIAGLFTATALLRVAHNITDTPTPTTTGCPYGDTQCGG